MIPFVISQHVEEAAFNWLLRDRATMAPHYSLKHLAKLDSRIEAHLDGVRIAGEAGWESVRDELSREEPGEVFVATFLGVEGGGETRLAEALAVGTSSPDLVRGAISALGWLPFDRAQQTINRLIRETSPSAKRAGIAGAAIHRSDPGPTLAAAIAAEDPPLRARALRAVGELGRMDLLPDAERHLKAEDLEARFSAAWSVALLSGKPEALSALATIAQSDSRCRERALQTAMRRADPHAAKVWQRKLAQESTTLRLAIQGAGAIGDPAEIPWLIEQMKTPLLARVAGESFTTITGVDIAYQDLEGERPEDFESGPTEDPADENVEMDPDENLPWPDPVLIQKWWQSNRGGFQPGTRHLIGKPITADWCKQVLRVGRQRQRAAAALELTMRQPGTPLFEVRAPGFRQKQWLGS